MCSGFKHKLLNLLVVNKPNICHNMIWTLSAVIEKYQDMFYYANFCRKRIGIGWKKGQKVDQNNLEIGQKWVKDESEVGRKGSEVGHECVRLG